MYKKEKLAQAPDKNPFGAKPTFLLIKLYPINYCFIKKKSRNKKRKLKSKAYENVLNERIELWIIMYMNV